MRGDRAFLQVRSMSPLTARSAAVFDDLTIERFWSKVDKSAGPDECWLWNASLSAKGYAYFWCNRKVTYGHRVSYMIAKGAILEEMMVDHICRNRACVNPIHLRQVTSRTNSVENSVSAPAKNTAKTHCDYGHPFSEENTKWVKGKNNIRSRECKTCKIANNAKFNARRSAARAAR